MIKGLEFRIYIEADDMKPQVSVTADFDSVPGMIKWLDEVKELLEPILGIHIQGEEKKDVEETKSAE